ncbi:MAG TPA: DNA polymerase I [Clostridiaceae bacterium]|nr:DNA polymerase I [Clostridiaceae bacterium]
MAKEKIMLIDGNSILNRAFYGLQGPQLLATSYGLYTNGVYGFLNILFKYLEEEHPDYICVAFDMKAPTFRHDQYEGYKANRQGMPDELAVQVPVIKEVLDAMNITRIEYPGYEADDLIGWLSSCAEAKNLEVVIVTGDRDSLQLVSENTRVKLPTTRFGKTTTEEYDNQSFLEKYGITPLQYIDVKALMGDKSDNIPGVKGIGEKTAFELIKQFGSIEEIYNNLDKIDRKSVREKLEADKEMAFLSKKLATIERKIPEELCTIEELKIKDYKTEKLYQVFKKLEFKSLIQKLGLEDIALKNEENVATGAEQNAISAEVPKNVLWINSLNDLQKLKERISMRGEIAIFPIMEDTREKGDLAGKLVGFAVSWMENNEDNENKKKNEENIEENNEENNEGNRQVLKSHNFISAYVDVSNGLSDANAEQFEEQFITDFKDIFENETIKKWGHNVKSFLIYLICKGIDLQGLAFDTMIAAYILNPSRQTYKVSELAAEYLNEKLIDIEDMMNRGKNKTAHKEDELYKDIDLAGAAVSYSQAIYKLKDVLARKIKENEQEVLYYEIELPLIEVLASMEYHGFKVNEDELKSFSIELDERIEELKKEIYDLAGEEFNINSTKQLGEILFDKLGLPVVKKTKTGYSTDAEVLEQLAPMHKIVSNILEYRQLMKLKSTYVDGLISVINKKTGKIHSSFNQTVVVTGRISSTEPNLQNIPVRLELGRKIRRVFVPSGEEYILIDADYSQIELRVLAHISGDENFIEAFRNNEDIHTSTAARVFGVPADEVTLMMRSKAKAINFGIIYGIGDFSLAKDLGVTRKQAKMYIDEYLDKYPGVRKYMKNIVEEGKSKGYVSTLFNRRRYLPELSSKNHNIRAFGQRVALNAPVQGTAADIIKIAMVKVYKNLKRRKMKSRLILQVHDELVIEAHVDEKEEVIEILKNSMEKAVDLKVPLKVDIKVGKNWYETK